MSDSTHPAPPHREAWKRNSSPIEMSSMALMHVEVFEALRSVMPEDKAIEGATRLYRVVSGDKEPTNKVQAEGEAGANTMPEVSIFTMLTAKSRERRTERYPVWVDFLIFKWMMATSIVMSIIIILKLFSH